MHFEDFGCEHRRSIKRADLVCLMGNSLDQPREAEESSGVSYDAGMHEGVLWMLGDESSPRP